MIELRRRYSGSSGGGQPSRLPAGYQEVEYLESTGTQYINTGIYIDNKTIIDVDFKVTDNTQSDWHFLLGSRVNMNNRCEVAYNIKTLELAFIYGKNGIYYKPQELYTKNKAYADGIVIVTNDKTTDFEPYDFDVSVPLVLFACYNYNVIRDYGIGQIWNIEVKKTHTNEHYHLIPCYRTSDKVAGMYDIVNDVFYTNAGTGEFLVGQDVGGGQSSILPQEYQLVEYLRGDGKSYIDCGIVLTETTEINVEFEYEDNPAADFSFITGCFEGNDNQFALSKIWGMDNYIYTRSFGSQNLDLAKVASNIVGMHKATLAYTYTSIDEVIAYNNDNVPIGALGYRIPIFASYEPPPIGFRNMSKAKIPHYCVKENGELIRDLYPCYRKSDNVAGMYDIVNGEFHTNKGSGVFIVGPDIVD